MSSFQSVLRPVMTVPSSATYSVRVHAIARTGAASSATATAIDANAAPGKSLLHRPAPVVIRDFRFTLRFQLAA
jgi:hypothetical protein